MAAKNGWSSYQKLVLSKLGEHGKGLESIRKEVKEIRTHDIPTLQVEIAMLKIKAGIWGAAAGVIPGMIAVVYIWIKYSTFMSVVTK